MARPEPALHPVHLAGAGLARLLLPVHALNHSPPDLSQKNALYCSAL